MSSISLKRRQGCVEEFYKRFILHSNIFKSQAITVQNLSTTNVPRIRISHKNYLCIVMFGEYGTPQYSLNWYKDDLKTMPEQVSHDIKKIAEQLVVDAKRLFHDVLPSSSDDVLDDGWGEEFYEDGDDEKIEKLLAALRAGRLGK
jgi:hypothetical protein